MLDAGCLMLDTGYWMKIRAPDVAEAFCCASGQN